MNKLIYTNLCGKILNQKQIATLGRAILAIRMLAQIKIYIGGDLRISFQGVPHLLYPNKNNPNYSIAYFRIDKLYRVFYPYPSRLGKQAKIDFKTNLQVIDYLTLREE